MNGWRKGGDASMYVWSRGSVWELIHHRQLEFRSFYVFSVLVKITLSLSNVGGPSASVPTLQRIAVFSSALPEKKTKVLGLLYAKVRLSVFCFRSCWCCVGAVRVRDDCMLALVWWT